MNINEARKIARPGQIIGYQNLDDLFRGEELGIAKGFVEAWDSQQAIIDKQREEIDGLKKKIDEWIADRDSWFERFDKRGKEIVELKAEIEGLNKEIKDLRIKLNDPMFEKCPECKSKIEGFGPFDFRCTKCKLIMGYARPVIFTCRKGLK